MKPIPPTPPGVKTAWADAEHMRLVRGLIEGWTDRPELVGRRRDAGADDLWATPLPDGEVA